MLLLLARCLPSPNLGDGSLLLLLSGEWDFCCFTFFLPLLRTNQS